VDCRMVSAVMCDHVYIVFGVECVTESNVVFMVETDRYWCVAGWCCSMWQCVYWY